ncbi:MAG TPA: hypothetical protein VM364_20045 [Vicinamibacterales bacterium]|nr:hypothetical protein [Vicinamibacterales bacterium]
MKRAIWGIVAAVMLAGIALTAQGKQDFTLVNRTGLVITELYVSPTEDDEWGEDILGRDVLKNGESADISFSRREKACKWDMKIVDEDDDEVVWTAIDLCKASHITLRYEGKKPTAIIK